MSSFYDLEIIKSVRTILVGDNTDPNPPSELSIHSYVGDNIFLNDTVQTNVNFPQITVDFVTGNGINNLPAEHGELRLSVWYKTQYPSARVLSRKCANRICDLLDHKPYTINDNNYAATVRLLDKFSSMSIMEPDRKLIRSLVIFDVAYKIRR